MHSAGVASNSPLCRIVLGEVGDDVMSPEQVVCELENEWELLNDRLLIKEMMERLGSS
jgi:hypothetical protein